MDFGHQLQSIIVRINEGINVLVVVFQTCSGGKLGSMGAEGELIKDDSWISGFRKWVDKSEMTQQWACQVLG